MILKKMKKKHTGNINCLFRDTESSKVFPNFVPLLCQVRVEIPHLGGF